ncbi:AI-2E family transporter [Nocardioides perillae]|uniref:Putative PurR-regulated permease PerM n=1 Tax=Nocardioides perillae TaxID=1119534 RepID=A0A7Y9USX9_9ACTN|nr:putative PurR-regulated permease PerM [Nocardioides perillae]
MDSRTDGGVAGEGPEAAAPSRARVLGAGISWSARWTVRWLVLVLGVVVLGRVVAYLWPVVLPVLLALLLATVLVPVARLLERRLRVPHGAAAGLAVLALVAVVVGGSVLLAPSIGAQLAEVAESASDGLEEVEQWVVQQSRFEVTRDQVEQAVDAAQERLRSSAASIASGVLVGINVVTSALVTTVLTLVLAFFFVKDGHRFLPWLGHVTGPRVGGHLHEVGERAWATLGGFIRTQALVGLIDAVLIGAGLLVVGVPLALPLAALTFVAAFAPIVGAITVGALAVLVALVTEGWVSALVVLGIVVVVQQLEGNVFLPWLQGRSLRLHSTVVLLAIVLGSSLYGVAGAFLSVPVAAVVAVVLRYLDEQVTVRTSG